MEVFTERVVLVVPYGKKFFAKQAGALWDDKRSEWYAPIGASKKQFSRWLPKKPKVFIDE